MLPCWTLSATTLLRIFYLFFLHLFSQYPKFPEDVDTESGLVGSWRGNSQLLQTMSYGS